MRPKNSAGKQFSPQNTLLRNLFLARFGDVVWTERQQAFLLLASWFGNAADLKRRSRKSPMTAGERRYVKDSEREFDSVARPVLLRALFDQDPQPFKDLVMVLEAMRRLDGKPVHLLQSLLVEQEMVRKSMRGRKADIAQLTEGLGKHLPEGIDPAQVRRACDSLGVPYKAGKRGRPKSDN